MNEETKPLDTALRDLNCEIRRVRQTLLVSFAAFTLLGGLVLLSSEVAFYSCFAAAAMFLLAASQTRITKIVGEVREEVRRSHSQSGRDPDKT